MHANIEHLFKARMCEEEEREVGGSEDWNGPSLPHLAAPKHGIYTYVLRRAQKGDTLLRKFHLSRAWVAERK